MQIQHDVYGRIEPSRIYLAKPNKTLLCAINGIDVDSVDFQGKANDISTITFDVNRYIQNDHDDLLQTTAYDLLSKYMKLYVTGIGWFILNTPETHSTGAKEYKTVTADSAQSEYNQVPLDTWKVNCGTTDSLEMLVDDNVEDVGGVEFAKQQIKFSRTDNPKLSLVDILISKIPGWKVGNIDAIPKKYETLQNGKLITTSVLLKDEVGKFDIDYTSCYSFLTQDFAKFFNVVVEFDYNLMTVNFYRVENYGEDTNVVIGFRNVENQNDITIDEENIFTQYRVSGGDNLGIEQWNGGDNYLHWLDDYWLNEKYFSPTTITKYKAWQNYLKNARSEYGKLSTQWIEKQEAITELNDRLPIEGCDTNWGSYNDDDLLVAKSDFEASKLGYEKSYTDAEGNFDLAALEASADADSYHQIVDVILPNIDIAIANHKLGSSVDMKDYITSYETNWKLYGINELENKLKAYRDAVNILMKDHYDLKWEDYQKKSSLDSKTYPIRTVEGYKIKHAEYIKNASQLLETDSLSCAYALNHRKQEVSAQEKSQKLIQNARIKLAANMALETWSDPSLGAFSSSELREIDHVTNVTTYQNENIFVTSIDSAIDKVLTQQKLCETALEDLKVYSIPQTVYTTSMDNILAIPGNELHTKSLKYGNLIRLGLRDDYYVKLRMISMSYNPLLYNNALQISFSNMIRSQSKRDDFVSLLNLSGNLTNGSANTSYSGGNQITDNNIYEIMRKLLAKMNGINSDNNFVSPGELEQEMIRCTDLHAKNGFFEYLQAELIAAGKIVADSGDFKILAALVARIDNLLAGNVSAELGHIISLTAENVHIDEAVIREIIAAQITVSMLKAGTISADKFSIESDDGGLSIVGNTMQFKDPSGNTRIQIGRDASNNFTFVLYDESGKGVLMDSTGIKESALSDGLIKDSMIAPGTISSDKVNWVSTGASVDKDGNPIWSEQNITVNGEGINVKFTSIEKSIKNAADSIENAQNQIDKTITKTLVQYYVSNSPTELSGGSWVEAENFPSWQEDKYVWSKTVTTYANGNLIETVPICITSSSGKDGTDAKLCNITGNTVMKYEADSNKPDPEILTLTAEYQGTIHQKWQYKTQTGQWSDLSSNGETIKIDENSVVWNGNLATLKALDVTQEATDTISLVKLRDGIDGDDAILLNITSVNGYTFKNTGVATILTVTIHVGETIIDTSKKLYERFGNDATIIWECKRLGETKFTPISQDDSRLSDHGFLFTLTPQDVDNKITFVCGLDI